jgi:hypothetical protein
LHAAPVAAMSIRHRRLQQCWSWSLPPPLGQSNGNRHTQLLGIVDLLARCGFGLTDIAVAMRDHFGILGRLMHDDRGHLVVYMIVVHTPLASPAGRDDLHAIVDVVGDPPAHGWPLIGKEKAEAPSAPRPRVPSHQPHRFPLEALSLLSIPPPGAAIPAPEISQDTWRRRTCRCP